MYPVGRCHCHGMSPIPREGRFGEVREVGEISGFSHSVGTCALKQGACKLTLNVKEGVIQEALVETIGCSGMTLRSNGASIGVNICLVSIFPTLLSAADFIFKRIGFQLSTGWIDANLSAVVTLTPSSGALLTGVPVGCVWLLLGIVGGTGMFRRQDIK